MTALVLLATFALGLWADARFEIAGQLAASAWSWALFLALLARAADAERRAMMACLAIATAGEIVLSLGAGLYAYRLGNIPFFIPPGHVFLYLLGTALARRMSEGAALCIMALALAYALGAALAGIDTFAPPLVALLVACALLVPAHRRLYASTFVLALALELYGTWIGNWAWQRELAGLGLVTTNPPAGAGALYAALDALVVAAAALSAAGGRANLAARG